MAYSSLSTVRPRPQRLRSLVAPLLLLALLGCARNTPAVTPGPVATSPAVSPLRLGLLASDLTAKPGSYVVLLLTWRASGEQLSAVEAEIKIDPAQAELVGIEDEQGAVTHLETGEVGTALITAISGESTTVQDMRLVLRLSGQTPAQVSVRLTQAVDSQGRSLNLGAGAVQTTVTLKPGEGGEATPPDGSTLEQQVHGLQVQRGLLDAQAVATKPLKVPTTLDASWAAYEIGDVPLSAVN